MAKKQISLKVGGELPKALGACVDAFKEVNLLRLAMDKDVKAIKQREIEIKEHLIENLSASDTTGVSGKRYRAQITREDQPTPDDWEKIYDYISENDRFDLMGKSLNTKAVKEMWDNDEDIPGVKIIQVKKLSITKL